MLADHDLPLNPHRQTEIRTLGEEESPLIIIDDALARTDALLQYAKDTAFTSEEGPGNFFPGVRAALPRAYARAMLKLLAPHLPLFGVPEEPAPQVVLNTLQMVTRAAEDLVLPQRAPHFDTFDGQQIALLHYLTEDDQGGTDFYRHRSTGYERISAERFRPYTTKLVEEVKAKDLPKAYMAGSDDKYECIESVVPRFNRVIAYFSNNLHSGRIEGQGPFPADVRSGRLMATVFARFG